MPHVSHAAGLDWIIEVTNEFGSTPRAVAGESDRPIPPLETPTPAWAQVLDDADMITAADTWFEVIDADGLNQAEICNRALSRAPLSLEVDHGDHDGLIIGWLAQPDAAAIDRLIAYGTAIIAEALSPDPAALGRCDADDCSDVFIDRSPRRNRSFCCVRCQGRARVRRYRANN